MTLLSKVCKKKTWLYHATTIRKPLIKVMIEFQLHQSPVCERGVSASSFNASKLTNNDSWLSLESALSSINVSELSNEVECLLQISHTAVIFSLSHTHTFTHIHTRENEIWRLPPPLPNSVSTEVGSLTSINYVNRME